jgi:hypothetical protein
VKYTGVGEMNFGTPLSTRVQVIKTRDKFEVDETVQNMNKGRSRIHRSSEHGGSVGTVLQVYIQSPWKSVRQCSRETGKNPLTFIKR